MNYFQASNVVYFIASPSGSSLLHVCSTQMNFVKIKFNKKDESKLITSKKSKLCRGLTLQNECCLIVLNSLTFSDKNNHDFH